MALGDPRVDDAFKDLKREHSAAAEVPFSQTLAVKLADELSERPATYYFSFFFFSFEKSRK